MGAQTALIQQGYWISNCATDLELATPVNLDPGVRSPLSSPGPLSIVEHSRDRLTLQLPTHGKGQVTLHLSTLDGFEFNAPIVARGRGVSFRLEDLPDGQLHIRARYPGPAEGAWASAAGLALALSIHGWAMRRTHS